MTEVDLIVKVTRQCNLRCTYCMDWREASPQTDMSFAVLARTIQAALHEHDRRVGFIWHGGETTIRPISFYKKAMLVQERFRRPGQVVTNLLQTNGTRLNAEWARFFRESRFHLGISLDGPPEIHDRTRPNVGGKGSFSSAMRGLEILREHEVPHAVLLVVGEELLALGADRVFDFFLEYGIRRFDCLSSMPSAEPSAVASGPVHYSRQGEMTAFLIRLYDRWLENGDPGIQIRSLDAVRNRLRRTNAGYCTMVGGCFGRYFTVEPNGDISHCDTLQGNPEHAFGNIMQMSFSDMRQMGNLPRAIAANNRAVDVLRERCPDFDVCHGGCPADRGAAFLYDRSYSGQCCGKRGLIEHIRSRMADEEVMLAAAC